MSAPSRTTRRVIALAAAPVAILAAGALVWQSSSAAFTSSTRNAGNEWSTGQVSLTDDGLGMAGFNAVNLIPGQTGARCLVVRSGANVAGEVRAYTQNLTSSNPALADRIKFKVEKGTGGTFADCTGFVPDPGALPAMSLTTLSTVNKDYATGGGALGDRRDPGRDEGLPGLVDVRHRRHDPAADRRAAERPGLRRPGVGAAERGPHDPHLVTLLGSLAPARTLPQEPGSARAETDPRPSVLGKDGWFAFVLGTVAQCYLVLLIALVGIATLPVALGWQASVVQTGSMRPHIQPGDVVLSSPLPDDQPVPLGSVVQFRAPAVGGGEHQVVHRIVAEGDTAGEWVTRGDANADQDSTALTRDKITGQGRLLVRWVGLPSLWWSTGQLAPLATFLVVTVAATWLTLWTWPGSDRSRRVRAPRERLGRTAAVVGVVGLAAATMALVAPEQSSAAFTAKTANVQSTFKVASWSTLSLGRATSYAVLACTRITNSDSHSTVLGSIGVAPGTSVTGFNAVDVTGAVDKNTPGAVNARADAQALYGAIAARSATGTAPATLTGTLTPGTLRSAGAVTVQGTLVLDARGDASAVFVVQAGALSFAPSTQVVLTNGAAADKVFFVSDSTTTAGTSAALGGVLLGQGDITLDKGTTLTGRAISLQGAVATKNASIVQPSPAG